MTQRNEEESIKVLIAEDDAFSRKLLQKALARWGYESAAVNDGLEALAALTADDAPEVAIIDWMMPGMDGMELCRQLRKMQKDTGLHTYLLVFTARMSAQGLADAFEAGADDFANKSFDMLELRVRLRVGARIVRLRRRLRQCQCGAAQNSACLT